MPLKRKFKAKPKSKQKPTNQKQEVAWTKSPVRLPDSIVGLMCSYLRLREDGDAVTEALISIGRFVWEREICLGFFFQVPTEPVKKEWFSFPNLRSLPWVLKEMEMRDGVPHGMTYIWLQHDGEGKKEIAHEFYRNGKRIGRVCFPDYPSWLTEHNLEIGTGRSDQFVDRAGRKMWAARVTGSL